MAGEVGATAGAGTCSDVKTEQTLLQFNRGKISPLALARVDLKRLALSAEEQTNFIPRTQGPMSLRPGWKHILTQSSWSDSQVNAPFVFAAADTAIIELHTASINVVVSDLRITYPVVTAAVTNGGFDTNFAGWTSVDPGTVNAWQTGGYAGLAGDGTAISSLQQEVTVNEMGAEHALRVVVDRGPMKIRVGSTTNGVEYLDDTEMNTGSHVFSFTPTGASFFVKVFNQNLRLALLDSVQVVTGALTLGYPFTAAALTATEQRLVRFDQSGDIVFFACTGHQQFRVLRRNARSWSVDLYAPDDGPFQVENVTDDDAGAECIERQHHAHVVGGVEYRGIQVHERRLVVQHHVGRANRVGNGLFRSTCCGDVQYRDCGQRNYDCPDIWCDDHGNYRRNDRYFATKFRRWCHLAGYRNDLHDAGQHDVHRWS